MSTVLIVDGDQSFAASIQSALEQSGHEVFVRGDLPLDLVKQLQPSILILDIEAEGGGSFFAACSKIRKQRGLEHIRVMLTGTGASAGAFEKHGQSDHAADDYAIKPLATEEFVGKVVNLLESAPPPLPTPDAVPEPASGTLEAAPGPADRIAEKLTALRAWTDVMLRDKKHAGPGSLRLRILEDLAALRDLIFEET